MKLINTFKFSPLFLFVCSVYSSESSDHALQKQSAATTSSSTDDCDSELTDNLIQEALAEGRTLFPPSQYRSVPFAKYRQSLGERYAGDGRFQSTVRRLLITEDKSKEVDAFLGSLTQQDLMNFARPLVLDILLEQISRIPKKQSLQELVKEFVRLQRWRHRYKHISREEICKACITDERQALVEKMNDLIDREEYTEAQEIEKKVLDDLKSVLDGLERKKMEYIRNLPRTDIATIKFVPLSALSVQPLQRPEDEKDE